MSAGYRSGMFLWVLTKLLCLFMEQRSWARSLFFNSVFV